MIRWNYKKVIALKRWYFSFLLSMRSVGRMKLFCGLLLFWLISAAVGFENLALIPNGNSSSGCVYPPKVANQADYYWRDYFGVIPKDAIPGGYIEDGNVTYVGQMAYAKANGIYPGNIYPGKNEAEICDGTRFVDGTYVKILCSDPRNKFEWKKTTINDSPLLTDYHWVVGGVQIPRVHYIGRAYIEGEVKVGRVYDITYPQNGLWICNKAGNQVNFKTFELLVLARQNKSF